MCLRADIPVALGGMFSPVLASLSAEMFTHLEHSGS